MQRYAIIIQTHSVRYPGEQTIYTIAASSIYNQVYLIWYKDVCVRVCICVCGITKKKWHSVVFSAVNAITKGDISRIKFILVKYVNSEAIWPLRELKIQIFRTPPSSIHKRRLQKGHKGINKAALTWELNTYIEAINDPLHINSCNRKTQIFPQALILPHPSDTLYTFSVIRIILSFKIYKNAKVQMYVRSDIIEWCIHARHFDSWGCCSYNMLEHTTSTE